MYDDGSLRYVEPRFVDVLNAGSIGETMCAVNLVKERAPLDTGLADIDDFSALNRDPRCSKHFHYMWHDGCV